MKEIKEVSCGIEHSVALDNYGDVYSWGNFEGGILGSLIKLGVNLTESPKEPLKIPEIPKMQTICCGSFHTLAVSKNKQVYSWGRGDGG